MIGTGGHVRWQEQTTPVCQSFPWLPTGGGASAQQRRSVLLSPTLAVLTQKVDKDLVVLGHWSGGLPIQVQVEDVASPDAFIQSVALQDDGLTEDGSHRVAGQGISGESVEDQAQLAKTLIISLIASLPQMLLQAVLRELGAGDEPEARMLRCQLVQQARCGWRDGGAGLHQAVDGQVALVMVLQDRRLCWDVEDDGVPRLGVSLKVAHQLPVVPVLVVLVTT